MLSTAHHVLSESPLNSEPSAADLVSSFLTPIQTAYNRNHGSPVPSSNSWTLSVSSEVQGVKLDCGRTSWSEADVRRAEKTEAVVALTCAGNRRVEMNREKEVEGLQWGGTAIANCLFGGPLLRDVLEEAGITLEKLEQQGLADNLHLHFETTQNCQDDDYFGASLPVRLALDPSRPVLLAHEQNGEPLTQEHGAPVRLVVPGVIGARSVKWLERIVLRDHESDNFYQQRDYKVLPPQATPETKEKYLKQTPALMEYPLNSEICSPSEGDVLTFSSQKPSLKFKGYAMGAHGIPISRVHLALLPLPASAPPSSTAVSEEHAIRLAASALPSSAWTSASLVSTPEGGEKQWQTGERNWGWTLFSAEVPVGEEVRKLTKTSASGGEGAEVALVCYAEDLDGNRQELQTEWNLRGVAEASWSVVKVRMKME
ncbi:hypothetical protein JCM10213_004353 [Rhodosporidiobolus nylandii]